MSSFQVWIVDTDKETGKTEKKTLEAVFHNDGKAAETKAQELEKEGKQVIIQMTYCKEL